MSKRRPQLLFLAYFFPPANSPGCARTWNIAKYLARAGWDIKILTPHPSVWRRPENVEQTVRDIRKEGIQQILTDHRWRSLLPDYLKVSNRGVFWFAGGLCRQIARNLEIDAAVGWLMPAFEKCRDLSRKDADLILASGSPFSSFRLARELASRIGCAYVLDYRDPWTANPHSSRFPGTTTVRREAELLAKSAAVTIVSDSLASDLERRFSLGSKLTVLTNGFCPEELRQVKPYQFDHFSIVYTGEFYPPKRIISPVFATLQAIKMSQAACPQWRFHYYGGNEAHVQDAARHFGLTKEIVLHGKVFRNEALSAVRGADVAVVITSVERESTRLERGIITGKLFEAIGSGTPTLVISPPGSDVEAIAAKTGLAQCYSGTDISGISSFLTKAMRGDTPQRNNPDAYSWTHLGERLNLLLRSIAGKQCGAEGLLSHRKAVKA